MDLNPKEPEEQQVEQISPEKMEEQEAEWLDSVFKDIEELASKHDISELSFIFRAPNKKEPLVFFINGNNNHYYDAAKLIAAAARSMKSRVAGELDC